MENYDQNETQGYYDVNYVPAEIKGWNWGAFVYNIAWGIGNNAYLTLLCLIPFFNIIWVFVCGAKGNEWAWKNGNYTDVATFQAVQSTWNRAGLVMFIISLVLGVIGFFFMFSIIAFLTSLSY